MSDNKSKMTPQICQELRELTTSINVVMDKFSQIKRPMQESSAKLPTTASQLERVTKQTEQATHKVLDMVEAISNRESEITNAIQKIQKLIHANILKNNKELETAISLVAANSEANKNDAYSIMDALQFQDITTQQINHAISLLDDVEVKLKNMLKAVGIKENEGKKSPKKKRVFDPKSNYSSDKATQQEDIDQIISGIK